MKSLETTRKKKRQSLFEAQDEIDERRYALITEIESRLEQDTQVERLFTIRWNLIRQNASPSMSVIAPSGRAEGR